MNDRKGELSEFPLLSKEGVRGWLKAPAFLILGLLIAFPVVGHELRPAYLELKQISAEDYEVLWKVPARGEMRLAIYVQLPTQCKNVAPPKGFFSNNAFIERWRTTCKGGLSGGRIAIDGLAATLTDGLVRIQSLNGTTQVFRVTPSSSSVSVGGEAAGVGTYLNLGIKHILLGFDHLLFVLGLLVLVGRRWGLMFKTISAFTVAHSLTLIAATLGFVDVPPKPLTAVIALSILFLGVEIARLYRGGTSITIEHPWAAAFGFGLVHGLGFASGLSVLGLPPQEIVTALLLFNVGVEIGQIAFVVLYLLLQRSFKILDFVAPRWTNAIPAYIVGSLGAYWTIWQVSQLFR